MSLERFAEALLRPLKPELYVGMRYQFGCSYGKETYTVTGIIGTLLSNKNGQLRFVVTAQGFVVCEVLALVKELDGTWLLHVRSGENFTQLIEGNLKLL
jgi:hypothetical protein